MTRRAPTLLATLLLAVNAAACTVVGYPAPAPSPAPGGRIIVERPVLPAPESRGITERPASVAFRSRDPRDPRSYEVLGRTYRTLATNEGYVETGIASWYGEEFQGRPTASGEPYDMHAFTAAHRSLPLGSCAEVKRVSDERSVVVRVNDRGPFDDDQRRIIDVSFAAAEKLGLIGSGTATIELTALPEDASC